MLSYRIPCILLKRPEPRSTSFCGLAVNKAAFAVCDASAHGRGFPVLEEQTVALGG